MSCDLTSTCAGFVSALQTEAAEALAAELALREEAQPLLDLINAYPGVWVHECLSVDAMPALSTIVNEIHSLGLGLSTWRYWVPEADVSVLTLPAALAAARVDINGVLQAPTVNYTLSGTALSFVGVLEIGDLVCVRSYGLTVSP